MATGIPKASSKNDIAPLTAKRLANVPIVAISAFKAMQEKEDRRTKDKYEVEQVKLSIDFDSGQIMRNADGEPVLDQAGNEQPFYINEGFVTLSGNEKAKFVEILKAIGFDGPEFIVQQGKDAGALTAAAAESLTVEFGTNGLGKSYEGLDWDDLPMYVLERDGGKDRKRDVEVPILSLKILGYEVIGRRCDLALTVKNGYNRVTAFLPPVEEQPLTKAAPKKAKGMPREQTMDDATPFVPTNAPAAPLEAPQPSTKHGAYVVKKLTEANVPPPMMSAVVWAITGLGADEFLRIEDVTLDAARNFKEMVTADPDIIRMALEHVQAGTSPAETNDDLDEEEDF